MDSRFRLAWSWGESAISRAEIGDGAVAVYTARVLFLESWARPLLVLHLVCAAVLVGATTHQLLWCRGYPRGQFGRARNERRFVVIASIAFVATFFLGNLMYPNYKVRVRAEYLDSPTAVAAEQDLRRVEGARLNEALTAHGGDLTWVGRLFDVKEHWVALGCFAQLVLLGLSRFAHPSHERRSLPLYLGLALFCCGTAWTGAVIGIVTASYRAVGGAA
jgi:hypothetical protein